jgi:hypothetical protein
LRVEDGVAAVIHDRTLRVEDGVAAVGSGEGSVKEINDEFCPKKKKVACQEQ